MTVISVLKVLPCFVMAAGLAAIAPPSLAQAVDTAPAPQQSTVTLAQATDADDQPVSPDDLGVADLTDEQIAQLETVFDTYQPQIDEATATYQTALENMNSLLVPSTPDELLVNGYNDLAVAQQTKDALIFQRNLALRSVLTLDQRQAINDYVRTYLGIALPEPVAVFPQTLVGSDAAITLNTLQADGWVVAFTSPSEVGLDRGSEKLDLFINRTGQISNAQLF